jgi:hypothetical protein
MMGIDHYSGAANQSLPDEFREYLPLFQFEENHPFNPRSDDWDTSALDRTPGRTFLTTSQSANAETFKAAPGSLTSIGVARSSISPWVKLTSPGPPRDEGFGHRVERTEDRPVRVVGLTSRGKDLFV